MFKFLDTKFNKYYESKDDGFSVLLPNIPAVKKYPHEGTTQYLAGWAGEIYMISIIKQGFTTINTIEESEELINNPAKLYDTQEAELKKSVSVAERLYGKTLQYDISTFLSYPCANLDYYNQDIQLYVAEIKFYVGDKQYLIAVSNKKLSAAKEKFSELVKGFKLL